MAIVQNPQNVNKVIERVALINEIPNRWGLCQQLGLFTPYMASQREISIGKTAENAALVEDSNYESRMQNLTREQRAYTTLRIPHFGLQDAILPADIDGKISFDQLVADISGSIQLETVGAVRAKKMARLRRAYADTLEFARIKLITTGDVYAPNGSLKTSYGATYNTYQEMGKTQLTEAVPLNSLTTSPLDYIHAARDKSQDSFLSGAIVSGFVCFAGATFFDKLVSHPLVTDYNKYLGGQSARDLLLGLLPTGMGLDARYRVFEFGGVFFVRVADKNVKTGDALVADGEAYLFPMSEAGVMFQTYFAPAMRFGSVNSAAQEVYYWEFADERGTAIDIESESNFLNWNLYPQAVVKLTIQP